MPKEAIYHPEAVTTYDPRKLVVRWSATGQSDPVMINDIPVDRSAINRLVKTLRRARDQAFGADE